MRILPLHDGLIKWKQSKEAQKLSIFLTKFYLLCQRKLSLSWLVQFSRRWTSQRSDDSLLRLLLIHLILSLKPTQIAANLIRSLFNLQKKVVKMITTETMIFWFKIQYRKNYLIWFLLVLSFWIRWKFLLQIMVGLIKKR